MLPEPNPATPATPPKRAAAPARRQPRVKGVMTPLFSVPDATEKPGTQKDTADLLTVTAERLRRALVRSYLRYGLATDLEAAIHAAMNVIEPVLEARDTEIVRLRRLMAGKTQAQPGARVARK